MPNWWSVSVNVAGTGYGPAWRTEQAKYGQLRLTTKTTTSNAITPENEYFTLRKRRISAMTASWPPTAVFQTPKSQCGGSGGRPVSSALPRTRSFRVGPYEM